MPVEYRIIPEHALVLVTYTGLAGLAETISQSEACTSHPDFSPDHRSLIDLRGLEDYERDFPGFFAMQAKLMQSYRTRPGQMFVFLAPTRIGQEMAQLVRRQWEGLDWVITRIVSEEDQAIEILGLPIRSLSGLTVTQ